MATDRSISKRSAGDAVVADEVAATYLEKLYAFGHCLYERGRFDDAADVFSLLTIHEPAEPRFWFARGAAEQERGSLASATEAYAFAALLDEEDPWALVHMGECLLMHGERTTGIEALTRAIARAAAFPGHVAARERAEGFLRHVEVNSVHRG